MFPNVRVMVAAMLASVVVLVCGFGIFAAFRVSREPIAHPPAAALSLQLVGENAVTPAAAMATREAFEQHSQFAVASGPEDAFAPATAVDRDAVLGTAVDAGQAQPETVAAMDAEPDTVRKPQATPEPADRDPMPPAPAGDLAATSENDERGADIATNAAPPPHQAEAATEPSAGNSETDANATAGETAATGSTAVTEPSPSPTNAETEPAAVATTMANATPDDTAQRTDADAALEPPLPRARPQVGAAQPAGMAPEHRQTAAAPSRPRHVRAARARIVTQAVRAVRFTAPYYAQTRYAQEQYGQSIEQGYGYGQSSAQAQIAAEQMVIRRAIALRLTRLAAARKLNPATGGPFVSARNP
jgi:hypothetical protein